MSYLLDKKSKRKKLYKIGLGIFILATLFYFRSGVSTSLGRVSQYVSRPVLALGNGIGEKLNGFGAYFASKKALSLENESLRFELSSERARMLNYDSLLADNASLREILGRKDPNAVMVASAILSKPNRSPYDTLLIDAGTEQGLHIGNTVFALGNIPIGRISEVFPDSAKVILFSSAGEKTDVILSGNETFMEMIGRGGGNFEMILPRETVILKGDQVVMPGMNSYVVAIAQSTLSDPRDPFTKVLLTSPVNIQELKFVEVSN